MSNKFLILLYLAAILALLAALSGSASGFPSPWGAVGMGMSLGVTVLASFWLVFGCGYWLARLVTVLFLIGLVSQLNTQIATPSAGEWMLTLTGLAAGIVPPSIQLYLTGVRIRLREDARVGTVPVRRWQFTVAGLLLTTTALALLLAWVRFLEIPWGHVRAVILYDLSFAAIGWMALWLFFHRGATLNWVVATLLVALVGGLLASYVEAIPPVPVMICTTALALVVLGGVVVAEMSNYFLIRGSKAPKGAAPDR